MNIAALIIALLVLAVVIWGGDRLLALLPANAQIKQVVRIVVIVVVALWFLSQAASFLGVPMLWDTGGVRHHR